MNAIDELPPRTSSLAWQGDLAPAAKLDTGDAFLRPDTASTSRTSKFTEVDSPTESLLAHPDSVHLDNLERLPSSAVSEWSIPELPILDRPPPFQTAPRRAVPPPSLKNAIKEGGSLFGTAKNPVLFDLKRYPASIAGYLAPSHCLSGDEFSKRLKKEKPVEQAHLEYDALWLDLQFFWGHMLRLHPNPIITDPVQVDRAVDLMCDMAVGRLLAEVQPMYPPQRALCTVPELRRRLQFMQLHLQSAMDECGTDVRVLGGCTVGLNRPRDKSLLWANLFLAGGADTNKKPAEVSERTFRPRNIASLLRLEDFLTHMSREYEKHLGYAPEDATLVTTAIGFMDPMFGGMIQGRGIKSLKALKQEWAEVLCDPKFRKIVALEVSAMASEAVAHRKKFGFKVHRDGCNSKVEKKPGLLKKLSMVHLRDAGQGKKTASPGLRTIFKKKSMDFNNS